MSNDQALIILLMGVSGSGKSTIGAELSRRLGWTYYDADDFHPAANVTKMQSGNPLNDDDRLPWLKAIAAQISAMTARGERAIVGCSALKQNYRDIIIGDNKTVRLALLQGDKSTISERLSARAGHFMPPSLLESQFETLEIPDGQENALIVSIKKSPEALATEIIHGLNLMEDKPKNQ